MSYVLFTSRCVMTRSYLKKVSAEIARLQKRKAQLEESAKKPPELEKEEDMPQAAEPKPRDLWQIIYAENRVSL